MTRTALSPPAVESSSSTTVTAACAGCWPPSAAGAGVGAAAAGVGAAAAGVAPAGETAAMGARVLVRWWGVCVCARLSGFLVTTTRKSSNFPGNKLFKL